MSTPDKPLALVTNDDGIRSHFLHALVDALSDKFEVVTCAPNGERSWIGHAITRHEILKPKKEKKFPGKLAYSLNGTPADCVNLACGNLLEQAPDIVISGINLGYNITLPMVLSSGTVGGALEASLLGHPAVAASFALPNEQFDAIRESGGKVEGDLASSLEKSAVSISEYAEMVVNLPKPTSLVVHNLNFPDSYQGDHPPMLTFADSLKLNSLFTQTDDKKGYQLTYRSEWLDQAEVQIGSDLWALRENMASVSRLDFTEMCGKRYLDP